MKNTGPDSSSGRASTSGARGCRFDTKPRHTKGFKNGTSGLHSAQRYKACTGFSRTTSIAHKSTIASGHNSLTGNAPKFGGGGQTQH